MPVCASVGIQLKIYTGFWRLKMLPGMEDIIDQRIESGTTIRATVVPVSQPSGTTSSSSCILPSATETSTTSEQVCVHLYLCQLLLYIIQYLQEKQEENVPSDSTPSPGVQLKLRTSAGKMTLQTPPQSVSVSS